MKTVKIVFPENPNWSLTEIKSKINTMSIKDRLMLRPLFPCDIELNLTINPERADIILIPSTSGTTKNNYLISKQLPYFKQYEEKFMYYINDDDPDYVYDGTKSTKLAAQPSRAKSENQTNNVIPIPLIMSDHYYIDDQFIDECRDTEKKYDFCFIGDTTAHGRSVLRDIPVDNYLFRDTKGFHLYSIQDHNQKIENIKKFLMEVAQCRFVFCPRGVGSSSFRLYESMMVGSIPIVTGMNDYPFESTNDWDTFSIRSQLDSKSLNQAVELSMNIDYNTYQRNAIEFWEKYGKIHSLFTLLTHKFPL